MNKNLQLDNNLVMRKVNLDINDIISQIKTLKGQSVQMRVNKGRKKIEKYTGVIEKIYPSIFTVRIDNAFTQSCLSYSYSEVLCGAVKIKKNEQQTKNLEV